MRIFLCGPMTGYENFNYPAFNAEAARLRALHYTVLNPAENGVCATWRDYMCKSIAQLIVCDTIAFLPGWSASRGARIEHALATDLGLHVTYASTVKE